MNQAFGELRITARAPGLHEISEAVIRWVAAQSVTNGLLTLFIRHTSASLLIQENAAPAARSDLERFFARAALESDAYEHDDEGPDDMPAHIRSALTQTHLSILVQDKRPLLGTWQGIFLFEHRRQPSERTISLHLLGD